LKTALFRFYVVSGLQCGIARRGGDYETAQALYQYCLSNDYDLTTLDVAEAPDVVILEQSVLIYEREFVRDAQRHCETLNTPHAISQRGAFVYHHMLHAWRDATRALDEYRRADAIERLRQFFPELSERVESQYHRLWSKQYYSIVLDKLAKIKREF